MKKLVAKKSDLFSLPNIGPKSVARFERIKIFSKKDFMKHTPEKLYKKMKECGEPTLHPAMLYVMRAAQAYEKGDVPREAALHWWMWQDINNKRRMLYE